MYPALCYKKQTSWATEFAADAENGAFDLYDCKPPEKKKVEVAGSAGGYDSLYQCPGGTLITGEPEYTLCYGNKYFGILPEKPVQLITCGNAKKQDKCGKWAKRKCLKKHKKGACRKNKVQKKCGYTCRAEVANSELGSKNMLDQFNKEDAEKKKNKADKKAEKSKKNKEKKKKGD